MIGRPSEFTQADWWDEDKVYAYCNEYPCRFCGHAGAEWRFPGSEWMVDLFCCRCGAHVGWMPVPDDEFMRQLAESVYRALEDDTA